MRTTLTPCAITQDNQLVPLNRVEFGDRRVAETFLQDALNRNPALLPLDEIDSAYGPLASLGREIESMDNLFLSPAGRITLVETKLWRNPESGREVVGQILDYASSLGTWSYEDLERYSRKAKQSPLQNGESLHQFMTRSFPNEVLPESQFIDAVQKNLRIGRFLLLIVGDGIREGVERMLGHLHEHPQRHFTFALVEIGIYENPSVFAGKILLPSLVAKTTEVVRAVVQVQTTGQAQVSVTTLADPPAAPSGYHRRTLSEDEFSQDLPDATARQAFENFSALAREVGAELSWGANSVSLRLPDPAGSDQRFTLLVLESSGDFYTGWLPKQLDKAGLSPEIGLTHVREISQLFPHLAPHPSRPDELSRKLKAAEVAENFPPLANVIRKTIAAINAATTKDS